jgi:hypothetical protein
VHEVRLTTSRQSKSHAILIAQQVIDIDCKYESYKESCWSSPFHQNRLRQSRLPELRRHALQALLLSLAEHALGPPRLAAAPEVQNTNASIHARARQKPCAQARLHSLVAHVRDLYALHRSEVVQ